MKMLISLSTKYSLNSTFVVLCLHTWFLSKTKFETNFKSLKLDSGSNLLF